jgi:hypothetical protein
MLHGSFLDQCYLGESAMSAPQPMLPAAPFPGAGELASDDLVSLPGGIVLPKRTLLLVAAAIAVAALIWWKNKR